MAKDKDYNSNMKLLKHLERLLEWDQTGFVFPVLVAINPSDACNNRCPLCSTKNKSTVMMSTAEVKRILKEVREVGVKAIGYGGGGEPLCQPDLEEILRFTKELGLESSLTSNGYTLTQGCIDAIVTCCTWTRISLDADGPVIYEKTHGMKGKAFDKVCDNIRKIAEARKRLNSEMVFGLTYLIGPHTVEGIFGAAKLARDLGADYMRFRPFFDWQEDDLDLNASVLDELERCKELIIDSFDVTYPESRVSSRVISKNQREYGKCYVHHFMTIVDADLKVYPCCMLVGRPEYCLGDLHHKTFKELWMSEERKKAFESIDLSVCPNPCMLDDHNKFLWTLKRPINHSNFL